MKKLNKFQMRHVKLIIISLFSFILGCMVTVNLIPINKTCQLDNTDREYNIMKNSKLKLPDLIILVVSSPANFNKRNAIRNTWLKLDNLKSKQKRFKHYFVIGSWSLNADYILRLSSEQSQYNDLLILPMYDSYANLTLKVLTSFVWLRDQLDVGFNFQYALKVDDDSFVRLDDLIHELKHIELIYMKSDPRTLISNGSPYLRINVQANSLTSVNKLQLYWGYFNGKAPIQTKGKWKENNWILCDHYLPYALGGGYLLSKNLITYLANNSQSLRCYNSEDVSIGMWLSNVDNVLRVHDARFDTEWNSRGCQNTHLIIHNLSIKEMEAMYDNLAKFGQICHLEAIKRPTYLYDWSSPPSKCCNNFI